MLRSEQIVSPHDLAVMIANPHTLAGALETMPPTPGLRIITTQELTRANLRLRPDLKVCITADPELDQVRSLLEDESRLSAIRNLKDKFAFRQLLSSIYPDLKFRRIRLRELPFEVLGNDTKYVLKPVKGCFGIGVRTITRDMDLTRVVDEVQGELLRNSALLPESALSQDGFLIETFIEGEEYAVDMFYDQRGQPTITNIYHHPMPRNKAYLHLLYYSSRDVFERIYQPAKDFFKLLNARLNVRMFPIHAEFRLHQGRLVPIELNPFRFGGMGLANLGFYSLGLNAYQCFVEDREPDWAQVWRDKSDVAYGFFIAYNGTHIDVTTHKPDWPRLRRLFSRILFQVPFDYQKQPVFGVVYVAETRARIFELLNTEFNDYFMPLNDT